MALVGLKIKIDYIQLQREQINSYISSVDSSMFPVVQFLNDCLKIKKCRRHFVKVTNH